MNNKGRLYILIGNRNYYIHSGEQETKNRESVKMAHVGCACPENMRNQLSSSPSTGCDSQHL